MKMYIVTREGVYRHEILGLYDSIFIAMEMAFKETQKESEDGYHVYEVSELEVGVECQDVVPLYSYQKKKVYDYTTVPYSLINMYTEIQRLENGKWEITNEVA